jgi:serine/threonine protein phosphatase PrpC
VGFCRSVIPTPDVFRTDLLSGTTQRFVIASDGLWDTVSNDVVGLLARRGTEAGADDDAVVDPRKAVTDIIQHCLRKEGLLDDVTILVIDVTI